MKINFINRKLEFEYKIIDKCIVGMALKTYMVLRIRKGEIQVNNSVWVKDMKNIVNLFNDEIPILVVKEMQNRWKRKIKRHKLSVIVFRIFSFNSMFKSEICLVSKRNKNSNFKNDKKNRTEIIYNKID